MNPIHFRWRWLLRAIIALAGLFFAFQVLNLSLNLKSSIQSSASDPFQSLVTEKDAAKYVAKHGRIYVHIIEIKHPQSTILKIRLENNGDMVLSNTGWSIYFNLLILVENEYFKYDNSYKLRDSGFVLHHLDGGLFQLTPDDSLKEIPPSQHVIINLRTNEVMLRHFVMPRWYTAGLDGRAYLVQNTEDDKLQFVTKSVRNAFSEEDKLNKPSFGSLSAEQRFNRYYTEDLKKAPLRILPTPHFSELSEAETISVTHVHWVACGDTDYFEKEIKDLAGYFKFQPEVSRNCPPTDFIRFIKKPISEKSDEAYRLRILKAGPAIEITAETTTGAFYAVQSLKSLAENTTFNQGHHLPTGNIIDWPQYSYRGIFLDVARNFMKTEDVIALLGTMALYKLNKLHLHLSDDESWRLEINGLPELTQVASIRRHSANQHESLIPLLGSGPFSNNSGSGYYSKAQYRKILRAASANHIEVIPEIDTPGHSRAAIKAMEARYHKFMKEGDKEKALEFLVRDLDDTTTVKSIQSYRGNALNPCMNSTYKFLDLVIRAIKDLHEPVQPLKMIHMGGDEVERIIWWRSPICKQLLKESKRFPKRQEDLQEYFFRKICRICSENYGLQVAAWGDTAFHYQSSIPFSKSSLGGTNVTAYDWKSNEEQRYNLLAADYKIVLATASYLYFDHPSEPDPDEVGMIWAANAVEDRTVFSFTQEKVFTKLNKSLPLENVVGMQAHIWSELLRDVTMIHYQLFPRLIALAERAWHKAQWEGVVDDAKKKKEQDRDWVEFANVVGYKELPRLRRRKIAYKIPPPGFRIHDGHLYINTLYPGFTFKCRILISTSSEFDWFSCHDGQPFKFVKGGTLQITAADNWRESKIVEMR